MSGSTFNNSSQSSALTGSDDELEEPIHLLMEWAQSQLPFEALYLSLLNGQMEGVSNEEVGDLSTFTDEKERTYKLIELIKQTDKSVSREQYTRLLHIAQGIHSSERKAGALVALVLSQDVNLINCLHLLDAARQIDDLDNSLVLGCVTCQIDLLRSAEPDRFIDDLATFAPDAFDFLVNELIRAQALATLMHVATHRDKLPIEQQQRLNHKAAAMAKLLESTANAAAAAEPLIY